METLEDLRTCFVCKGGVIVESLERIWKVLSKNFGIVPLRIIVLNSFSDPAGSIVILWIKAGKDPKTFFELLTS
jgi:hypothetical protein